MKCRICDSEKSHYVLSKERYGRTWNIYECENCQTQFVYPIPTEDELEVLYREYYESSGLRDLYNPNYGILSYPRQWGIIKWLTKKKNGVILDYGCGGGHFLDRVSRQWDRYGVELANNAREVAIEKGIKAYKTIEELPVKEYDVIVMFAVIEHLRNPKEVVIQLGEMLKTGGLFIVMTGDVSSVQAILEGDNWHLYTPPGHLYFFTKPSLDNMMKSIGYKKIKSLYTDGGVLKIRYFNLIYRVLLEIHHRIPLINTIPIFDTYYGYYRKG